MSKSFTERKRIRKSFGRIREVAPMPDLVRLQIRSYQEFLQMDTAPENRNDVGLESVFRSVFPVKDFSGRAQLEYVKYEFDVSKYDLEESRRRGSTFSAPLKATFRLVTWDVDDETNSRTIRNIKEQDVYIGDMPLMTDNATFIFNGTERVVVSQMHRSPGVFFGHDQGKTHASGKFIFSARIIPYRGSWLDFEFDAKDFLFVRIDRRRKLPVTTLLMALENDRTVKLREEKTKLGETLQPHEIEGLTREEILNTFYKVITYKRSGEGWKTPYSVERFKGLRLNSDLIDAQNGTVIAEAGTKINQRMAKKFAEDGLKEIFVPSTELYGQYCANDIINFETGEIFIESGDEINSDIIYLLGKYGIDELPILDIDHINVGAYLRNTLMTDKNHSREEALKDIYRVMRPGEPPTLDGAEAIFSSLFFDIERYDLSAVGRVKMNARLGMDTDPSKRILQRDDIIEIVRVLLDLKDGRGEVDDIDDLRNRRVRTVGELLENQFRIGLLRIERTIRERMGALELDNAMPNDLVNAKPVAAAVREFFGTSQLSQFMDQTNPLSEITHKRRLSALGPGGISRERAGLEVRDVHPTHYGRICPIETPEGPNIGLINSLATYANINDYGFIETPYRKVIDGRVTDEIVYLSAGEESRYTIAQSNSENDEQGNLTQDFITCRRRGDVLLTTKSEIDFMDISPKQLVSVAAALIPFLENDDANRALMGSNMQRQAVPLLKCEAPLVGTGIEKIVAKDSGVAVVARRGGVIDQVDGNRIVIRVTDEIEANSTGVDIYNLRKFQRSNHSTCINQKPLVKVGDKVNKGDIVADGPATELGELALGRNVVVAFMPWGGYNFEDSIIISERVVRDDVFTSIHIESFEVMARDTKLGNEEITRDIPNVGDEMLKHLDEEGIICVGAEVKPGDILVGRVTPKGESAVTPEEKLLRAIFGEKASDVRDTSLRVPPGIAGTIVDVHVFSRRGVEKDERALAIEYAEIERLAKDRDAERSILERDFYGRLKDALKGQKIVKLPIGKDASRNFDTVTDEVFESMTRGQWRQIVIEDEVRMNEIEQSKKQFDSVIDTLNARFEEKVSKVKSGDELPQGVLKMVKVYIATKRKLQPGDKMAGRHGNKGVVSTVVPVENMPHLEDGRPVDVILNPLGVPSRMNVGQILETHLGWASVNLGRQIGDMLDAYRRGEKSAQELRTFVGDVYENQEYKDDVKSFTDSEVETLANHLRPGVPMATPVFDGAKEEEIVDYLKKAGCTTSGQVTLIDGRIGEPFERKVTVGCIYILKLHHLVDDKIHARSVGSYSLVTQQPLGGKAQFGGQRFGEMEVWALQAYGAAYTLQELLTLKSDDVTGRVKVYESIIRGDEDFEPSIPESFNVLVKELRSLALNVDLKQNDLEDFSNTN